MLLGLHRGLSRKQITALIPDIEEFSELGMFFDMPVRTYSSGMLTRLGFAFATAVDPDILILDEWITPGDAAFMNRAAERMSSHAGNARALLLASHSVEIIKRVCTRVIVLERGVIVEDGPPLEVFDRLDSQK
jgi:ABC-type polysaccharide/polyol phosphate transport system ATPase subunit